MAARSWSLVLTNKADADLDSILVWTREKFGPLQADAYYERIIVAMETLCSDPHRPTSRDRADAGAGLRSLPVGRRSRHVLYYRVDGEAIIIVRILHDSMDVARHLPIVDEEAD